LSIDFVKTAESIDITPSNMKAVDVADEKVYIINSATPSSSSVFPSPSASYISVRNPGNVSLSKLELHMLDRAFQAFLLPCLHEGYICGYWTNNQNLALVGRTRETNSLVYTINLSFQKTQRQQ
jgi:hypothetical protein